MNEVETTTRRRWLRFGLRSLLIFIALIGMAMAWLVKPLWRYRTEQAVVAGIEAVGGSVQYDYQIRRPGEKLQGPSGNAVMRRLFGDNLYASVDRIWFLNSSGSDKDVAQLAKLSDLRHLALHGTGFTDKCIDDLLRLDRLQGLALLNTSISPQGLARLSQSATLESLSLDGGATDAHLATLSRFPHLQFFQVSRSPISNEGLKTIALRDGLKQLNLYGVPQVTDRGIASLSSLKDLEHLWLVQTGMTDASMPMIGGFRRLKSLDLRSHPITEAGIEHLSALTELQSLQLSYTEMGDPSLDTLCKLRQLEFLDLSGTAITDAALNKLTVLPNLVHLDIYGTAITDKGMQQLKAISSLKSLVVGPDVTEEGIEELKKALPDCVVQLMY